MSWRQEVEPFASAWRFLLAEARGRGLVHAMAALDHMPTCGPAEVADLLRDMVAAGALEALKADPHGPRMHSVLAFRGLQGGKAGRLPTTWSPTDAHCFTYRIPPTERERAEREALSTWLAR